MAEPPDTRVLDYRSPPPASPKYVEDAEERSWRWRRVLLRGVIVLPFLPFMFYFGPNVVVTGRFTRPTMADFVAIAQTRVVPIVRALKQYQRDTGRLPKDMKEEDRFRLKYLPGATDRDGFVENGVYQQFVGYSEEITYDFTPGAEGFSVRGPYVNGVLPMPPVDLQSPTQP